jgi:outer membrane protein assembly factor BamA
MRIFPPGAAIAALMILLAAPLAAQDTTMQHHRVVLGLVDTVIVTGNEKTKSYVILDEMALRPGSLATQEAIEYDRARIYSLGLFTSVDIYYDSLDTQHFLFVSVRERWYIIPIPIVGFRDGDTKKPYYGAGVTHTNFLGRNQRLSGALVFGFDPEVSFAYEDPLFDRDNSTYAGVAAGLATVRNRSLVESALTGDFDEHHRDIDVNAGKRFSLFETAGINVGVHSVAVSFYRAGRTASPSGTDIFLYATISYSYDSRDLREYAMQGALVSLSATKDGFGESRVDFSRFGIDFRKFIPLLSKVSVGVRAFTTRLSGTIIPTYARSYFGLQERVRGYYQALWEGENLAGGTIEFRYLFLSPLTFQVTSLPLPREFAVWRFGAALALFSDAGAAWFRHDKLSLPLFGLGYGGGLDFLLPYSFILRTEYAWNDHGKGEFIIDLRTSI